MRSPAGERMERLAGEDGIATAQICGTSRAHEAWKPQAAAEATAIA